MPDHHGAESIGATGGNRPNILWGGRDVKPPGQDRAPGRLSAPVPTRRDLGRRGLPLRGAATGDHRNRVGLVARSPARGATASHSRGPGGGCVTSTNRSHNGTRLPGNPAQRARSPLRPGHGPRAKVPDRIADGRVAAGSARGRDGGGGGQGGRSPPFRGSKGRHAGGQPGGGRRRGRRRGAERARRVSAHPPSSSPAHAGPHGTGHPRGPPASAARRRRVEARRGPDPGSPPRG